MSDITTLRAALFAQMDELRAADPKDAERLKAVISKASAVSEIAKTITDTARVEVDYLRASGGGESAFLGSAQPGLPPGIKSVTRHRLAG